MKKAILYFLSILYILFGLLQWNDPDWYVWIPVYFITAAFLFRYTQGKNLNPLAFYFFCVLVIWTLFYIPDWINWIQDGMPSITGSMKAESPYIELIREFFGLLICLIAVTPIAFRKKR